MKNKFSWVLALTVILQSAPLWASDSRILSKEARETKRQEEVKGLQENFKWWPTDASPGPVKDEKRGGYWWWPTEPGKMKPWGNRGYVYVRKIIFDCKEEELPAPQSKELRPSLLIKKVIKNVKIYFDYDNADLRDDHITILEEAVRTLRRNPDADILITGNCDRRGSEAYNQKLGNYRGEAVKNFMIERGIQEERVLIVSKGKLDAVAPITDLVGMQKDRNAQFMVAEVKEIMVPYSGEVKELGVVPLGERKYLVEKNVGIESQIKVSTREYAVKEQDTLKSIARKQLGGTHRWKYLYEFNKERIENPDSLEPGTVIIIPVEQEAKQEMKQEMQNETPQEVVAPFSAAREYVISKNDSLWKIAKKHLGDGKRWGEIYELNKDKIKNPDKLIPGTKILIPA
ncbi:MAG: LysM peptidoglycan-binding domain-containing protein [Candidatus Omnitrophota bacterium]